MARPRSLTPFQAFDWLSAGQAVLIDVREPAEFAASHIAYAVSAPLARMGEILAGMALPADRRPHLPTPEGRARRPAGVPT